MTDPWPPPRGVPATSEPFDRRKAPRIEWCSPRPGALRRDFVPLYMWPMGRGRWWAQW